MQKCDLCGRLDLKQYVDGRTKFGYWANMCVDCHSRVGVGLGTGFGQKFEKQENGEWKKIVG